MNELLPCPFCGGHVDVEKTHIDTLEQTAAERVIADGSSGPTPDYTGEGSAWVPPVEALVVAPDLTPDDCLDLDEILQEGPPYDEVIPKLAAWICEHSRAIPAGSMLGTGMVAVDAEELLALERVRMEAEYAKDAFQQMGEFSQMEGVMRALHELDALRANQGGAAT